MDDTDFETALAAAFQAPIRGAIRRDMTETILQRVASNGWARAGVLAGAALVGVLIAASALVLTQLAEPIRDWGMEVMDALRFHQSLGDPTPLVVIGLTLMVLALGRNAIRDL